MATARLGETAIGIIGVPKIDMELGSVAAVAPTPTAKVLDRDLARSTMTWSQIPLTPIKGPNGEPRISHPYSPRVEKSALEVGFLPGGDIHCGYLVVTALVLVLSSCSSGNSSSSNSFTVDRVEASLNTPVGEVFPSEFNDEVNLCMEFNGFDGFRYEQFEPPEDSANSIQARLDEIGGPRNFISEYGSGLVTIQYQDDPEKNPHLILPPSEIPELDPDQLDYLYGILVKSHREEYGESIGCAGHAERVLEDRYPSFKDRQLLSDKYANFMSEALFSSSEYLELEDQKLRCVQARGFDELTASKSQDQIISERNQTLIAKGLNPDSPEVAALIQYDKELALAIFDCDAESQEQWVTLRDTVAQRFLDENWSDLEGMLEEGSSR